MVADRSASPHPEQSHRAQGIQAPGSDTCLEGAAAAIVGLLPWLATGMRLPLQNRWVLGSASGEMPIVLLPFSQYTAALIAAVLLTGAAVAGIVGRPVPARHLGTALIALIGGVLIVQVIATVQTAVTERGGLSEGAASTYYLGALVGGTVAVILVGVGLLALIARVVPAR